MKQRLLLVQVVFALAGLWVGLTACGAGSCRPARSIIEGTFTQLKVADPDGLPAALAQVTFQTLTIGGNDATLAYQSPGGPGTVTLTFYSLEPSAAGGTNSGGTSAAGGANSGGAENNTGTGGSAEPWRTETDPVDLCWHWDEAFCTQFIECFGPNFSTTICTEDPASHAQCSRASAVNSDYVACMEVLTTPPCIGSLPALCDGVIVFD